MKLFPIIQPELTVVDSEMPLYKEVAWNFEDACPIFKNGNPVFITGKEAVKVWVWKALITVRTLFPIYTWAFGNETEMLLGQNFTEDTKRAEAARYVREALEINPYITDISNITVDFIDSSLIIAVTVTTIYGGVDVVVRR